MPARHPMQAPADCDDTRPQICPDRWIVIGIKQQLRQIETAIATPCRIPIDNPAHAIANHKQIVRPEVAVDDIIVPQPEHLLAGDQIGEARKHVAGGGTVPRKRVAPARLTLKDDRQDIRRPIRLAG
jgi:hypothetical protein